MEFAPTSDDKLRELQRRFVELTTPTPPDTDTDTDGVPGVGVLDQTAAAPAALLEHAAACAITTIMGASAPPTREALRALIAANAGLIGAGDMKAISAALARQATALEVALHGLLGAMAGAGIKPEQRLALAKAAATLHGSTLRCLSALRQISAGAGDAPLQA